MEIEKNYLHNNFASLGISRNKFLGGIILGLFYAFIIYSLLYLTRESYRILTVTENYDLWILTDTEVNFYNLFYSFISVIFAQSICFSFWLSGRRSSFAWRGYRRTSIINDQNVLNWTFMLWFSKMAVVYVTFFGFLGGFYVFSLFPDYNYLFILIIIVLYLHSWISIRRIFKNKSLRWMLISIFIVSGLSIGLSRINLIDYKAINKTILKMDICYKYKIEIPESNVYARLENRYLIKNIYVATAEKSNNNKPILIIDDKKIELNLLSQIIDNWQMDYDAIDIPRIKYQLHIDKNIPMSFINNLKKELGNNCVSKIAYAVLPKIREYDKRYYRNYAIMLDIPCSVTFDFIPPHLESYFDLKNYENIIEIKTENKSLCHFNTSIVKIDSLKEQIKWLIKKNPNYIIKFNTTNNDTFSAYLKLLSIINEAINELRNDYALSQYKLNFIELDEERKNALENRFPLRLYEDAYPL